MAEIYVGSLGSSDRACSRGLDAKSIRPVAVLLVTPRPKLQSDRLIPPKIPISWHFKLIICLSSGSKFEIVSLSPPEIWEP